MGKRKLIIAISIPDEDGSQFDDGVEWLASHFQETYHDYPYVKSIDYYYETDEEGEAK